MKVRFGFVSNSSSSSFCIYGVEIKEEDYEKITNFQNLDHSISDNPDNFWGGATYIIGINACDLVKDKDKTIKQIEEETKEKLTQVLNKPIEQISIFQNGWYDG